VALLARFACGCKLRVEIPVPPEVRCAEHGTVAQLIQTPNGQVRYTPKSADAQDVAPRSPNIVNRL
jgi:hypothetical protein